jgi:hypothetical protein
MVGLVFAFGFVILAAGAVYKQVSDAIYARMSPRTPEEEAPLQAVTGGPIDAWIETHLDTLLKEYKKWQ